MSQQWKGNTGTPLTYSRASRKTEDRYSHRPVMPAIDDDDRYYEQPKPHTSSVRYERPQVRHTAYMDKNNPKKTKRVRERTLDKWTLIMVVCILFMVMVGGWWLFTTVSNWWTNWENDLHYGNPRTYQTDQFTGQGDSPDHPDHFIAVNLNGRVIVVQLNLQHPDLDQSYAVTTTDPKNPVSLTFRLQGNTLAMYVIIGDASNPYTVELVSNGKQFVGA